jgi:hypothetical protein
VLGYLVFGDFLLTMMGSNMGDDVYTLMDPMDKEIWKEEGLFFSVEELKFQWSIKKDVRILDCEVRQDFDDNPMTKQPLGPFAE